MAAPTIGHLDPEFLALMERVQADLRSVMGTRNRLTLPISGTGSAGMEAAITNLVEPGDRVVVGIHGVFGGRLAELVRRQGGELVEVRAEFGSALDQEALVRAIDSGPTSLVAFVHAETSTGVLQPFDAIVRAARDAGALVLADCVTSLGGVPVDADTSGFDAVYSGTQKCLSVPPGLSPFSLSPRAMEKVAARRSPPTSWYLDVGLLAGYWDADSARVYHHTAPIQMVYGLAAGLDEILEEGLEARFARHRHVGEALWSGLAALGLSCAVDPSLRLPMLTSVVVPDGIDEKSVRRHLRDVHRIEIGGGLGSLAGRTWRIGLMGHGARLDCVLRVLAALADALAHQGFRCDPAAALNAAQSTAAQSTAAQSTAADLPGM
jgi:alanine-glyoxylate transaminase/serine-glyoxylate transaminase/serine-pyruvate transaminase